MQLTLNVGAEVRPKSAPCFWSTPLVCIAMLTFALGSFTAPRVTLAYLPPPEELAGVDSFLKDPNSEFALLPGYLALKGGVLDNVRDLVSHPETPLLQELLTQPDHSGVRMTRIRSKFGSTLTPAIIATHVWPLVLSWRKEGTPPPSDAQLHSRVEALLSDPSVRQKITAFQAKYDGHLAQERELLAAQKAQLSSQAAAVHDLHAWIDGHIRDSNLRGNLKKIGDLSQKMKRLEKVLAKSPNLATQLPVLQGLQGRWDVAVGQLALLDDQLRVLRKDMAIDHPDLASVRASGQAFLRQLYSIRNSKQLPTVLSALVWLSAENKADLLPYYNGLQQGDPISPHAQGEFLTARYGASSSPAPSTPSGLSNADDLAPLAQAYTLVKRQEPPVPLNYFANATVGSSTFPACGEVFALNLLRLLVEKEGRVDGDLLEKLGASYSIREFLTRHPDLPELAQSVTDPKRAQSIYDEFANLMSGVHGVDYNRGGCEITGSHASMLRLFQSFFRGLEESENWDDFFTNYQNLTGRQALFEGTQLKNQKTGNASLHLEGSAQATLAFMPNHFWLHFPPGRELWKKSGIEMERIAKASALAPRTKVGLLAQFPADRVRDTVLTQQGELPLHPALLRKFRSDDEILEFLEEQQRSPDAFANRSAEFTHALQGLYGRLRNTDGRSRFLEQIELDRFEPFLELLRKVQLKPKAACEFSQLLTSGDVPEKRRRKLMAKISYYDRNGACAALLQKYLASLSDLELAKFISASRGHFGDAQTERFALKRLEEAYERLGSLNQNKDTQKLTYFIVKAASFSELRHAPPACTAEGATELTHSIGRIAPELEKILNYQSGSPNYSKNTVFLNAFAATGNWKRVDDLLKSKTILSDEADPLTPLLRKRNYSELQSLLERDRQTPFLKKGRDEGVFQLILKGNDRTGLKMLLDAGFYPKDRNYLFYLINRSQWGLAETFLQSIRPERRSEYWTDVASMFRSPLEEALSLGNLPFAKDLALQGAPFIGKSYEPLARVQDPEFIAFALEQIQKDPAQRRQILGRSKGHDDSLLSTAVEAGNLVWVEKLLQAGADLLDWKYVLPKAMAVGHDPRLFEVVVEHLSKTLGADGAKRFFSQNSTWDKALAAAASDPRREPLEIVKKWALHFHPKESAVAVASAQALWNANQLKKLKEEEDRGLKSGLKLGGSAQNGARAAAQAGKDPMAFLKQTGPIEVSDLVELVKARPDRAVLRAQLKRGVREASRPEQLARRGLWDAIFQTMQFELLPELLPFLDLPHEIFPERTRRLPAKEKLLPLWREIFSARVQKLKSHAGRSDAVQNGILKIEKELLELAPDLVAVEGISEYAHYLKTLGGKVDPAILEESRRFLDDDQKLLKEAVGNRIASGASVADFEILWEQHGQRLEPRQKERLLESALEQKDLELADFLVKKGVPLFSQTWSAFDSCGGMRGFYGADGAQVAAFLLSHLSQNEGSGPIPVKKAFALQQALSSIAEHQSSALPSLWKKLGPRILATVDPSRGNQASEEMSSFFRTLIWPIVLPVAEQVMLDWVEHSAYSPLVLKPVVTHLVKSNAWPLYQVLRGKVAQGSEKLGRPMDLELLLEEPQALSELFETVNRKFLAQFTPERLKAIWPRLKEKELISVLKGALKDTEEGAPDHWVWNLLLASDFPFQKGNQMLDTLAYVRGEDFALGFQTHVGLLGFESGRSWWSNSLFRAAESERFKLVDHYLARGAKLVMPQGSGTETFFSTLHELYDKHGGSAGFWYVFEKATEEDLRAKDYGASLIEKARRKSDAQLVRALEARGVK